MVKLISIVIVILAITSNVFGQNYGVSLKLGTLGVHVEGHRSLNKNFNIHVGGSFFGYTYDKKAAAKDNYSLNADLSVFSFAVLADWFPFQTSSWRLSSGLSYNSLSPKIKATPEKEKVIGGDVYNKDNLGTLGVDISFNKIHPYVGLGFGNAADGSKGLGFLFDLGVYYMGSADVKLKAEGLLEPTASPEQQEIVKNNLSWLKWYPVLSFGIVYKF